MSGPSWLPLAGRSILVTSGRRRGDRLRDALRGLGASVVDAAAIRILPLDDPGPIDQALAHLGDYVWLIVTSANGAEVLVDRLRAAGQSGAAVAPARVAAIGPATARTLREAGIGVAVCPAGRFRSEGLLEALAPLVRPGDRVLLLRASEGRPALPDGLAVLGARVDVVAAYRTVREEVDGPALRREMEAGRIDAVTFSSGSAARRLAAVVGVDALRATRARIICLGPVTAQAAEAAGVPVDRVAEEATVEGIVAALVAELSESRESGEEGVAPPLEGGR